ncbi:hypothetical protein NSQ77_06530 [Oceanobacillus sp. FSL K6-2867]|uniref:hypothetical protein n=1 Tax=Oceanobacillus sp. FSL K6-2867 TaxID=2954748 RepID=UPI0030DC665D
MENKTDLPKSKKVFVVAVFIILLLLSTTVYFYVQYNKASESNKRIKSHAESDVLFYIEQEKNSIESLMTRIASNKPAAEKSVHAQAYTDIEVVLKAIQTLEHTLDKEPEEMEVLRSLEFTLSSLRSILGQIDGYYGFRNQQPFELKNCASGRIENEADIHNELNKFLKVLDYSDGEELDWDWNHFVANWEVDNPYSCSY